MGSQPEEAEPQDDHELLEIESIAFAEQARRPLEEDDCSERACKALAHLGFEGLREDVTDEVETPDTPDDPFKAWRQKLQQEGKTSPEGTRLVDLINRPQES